MRPTNREVIMTNLIFNMQNNDLQYITEDETKLILTKYGYNLNEIKIETFRVNKAEEDKILGFVADHFLLKVILISNNEWKVQTFFLKTVSQKNEAKAAMINEFDMFDKELKFFSVIKDKIDVPGLPAWCARFVTNLENRALVFEDLTPMQYEMRDKYLKYDRNHISEALKALARFHSTSIICEERMTKEQQRPYRLYEEYAQYLSKGHIQEANPWFSQSKIRALTAIKEFSKYAKDKNLMKTIEERWFQVWNSALCLSDPSSEQRNVICHRDLWNNNLLFHYEKQEDGTMVPDDCVLVDCQGVRCQPPAGDIMMLLHCNLEPQTRKAHLNEFLDLYYDELKGILWNNGIDIQFIITKDVFYKSAKDQNLWGLVLHASVVQVFWLDDDLTMEMFSDSDMFQQNLLKDRSTYIKAMIQRSEHYKQKILETIEEFVDEYILV